MSGETLTGQAAPVQQDTTATTGAAQDNAATAQPQTDGGEGGEGETHEVPAAKTFTQKDVDEIVKRAKAATESKTERRILRTLERLQPQQSQPQARQDVQQAPNDGRPTRTQGESDDAYFDRIADWKLDRRDRQAAFERQREQVQALGKKTNGIYAEAEKLGDDFDREAFDEHVTQPIAAALVESDDAARLMHFLGAHPDEMQRIAQLSPARQAAELGKLEVKLASAAEKAKPIQRSNAPQALAPVKAAAAKGAPDPSDSAAWIRFHNERESARLRGSKP